MRKIISKKKQDKDLRTKQLIVGGILIVIMLISTLGYSFQDRTKTTESNVVYNNFEFTSQDNLWYLEKDNSNFVFKYNPEETENFEFNEYIGSLNNYYNQPVYLYSEDRESETEIYRDIYQTVQRVQSACLDSNVNISMNCQSAWPIKNCSNNFILIKEGEFNVKRNEKCIFITGPKENLTQISDEFLFKLIGIK